MNTIWDILYLRSPVLNYISPPICEVIFSGSSSPVIILSYPQLGRVTGLVLGGAGGFRLSWNAFPGAICYNVYFLGQGQTVAVLLAQCIPDTFFELPPGLGPGEVVVTAITLDGETPPSDPVTYPGTVSNVNVETMCQFTSRVGFPGVFKIYRTVGDTTGNLIVDFTLSGTAVNGVDYGPIPLSATIPNGAEFVLVDIEVIEATLVADKTVTLTITPSFSYVVDSPGNATLDIILPVFRIVGYGDSEPLFQVDPLWRDSEECEWDGTLNTIDGSGAPQFQYYYFTFNDAPASIQGKAIAQMRLRGPIPGGPPDWEITISCHSDVPVFSTFVWAGLKTGGATAAGIYTIDLALTPVDPRLTIEIEAFP